MHRTSGLLHYRVTNYLANGRGVWLGIVLHDYSTLARQFNALFGVTLLKMFKRK